MSTQKDNKMSQRMKGAFGKMKSSKMKFNMTKPKSGQSTNQLKNMFNRFNKKTDDDRKWSTILSGSWEIELPVGEFLNASSQALNDKKDNGQAAINDPNSVSNQQCPLVQIYENLKVISIPLSTDIANPHIHLKYLSNKCISTNSTRLKMSKEKDNRIFLLNYKKSKANEDDEDDAILEGTINSDAYSIRWSDGSSWNKQCITIGSGDDDMSADTPSMETYTTTNTLEMKELRSQLSIAQEKEQMAKSQTQAMMGQLADLSQQYAKITTEHETLHKDHEELKGNYDGMSKVFEEMKQDLAKNNEELTRVRGDMVFEKQQQIQTKLTSYKTENEEYAKSIKLQQERILSLQDQLQSSHIATRQYTKTIEDLEVKMRVVDKDQMETKAVLNEMNNKFVTSQTNLDDAKHKEMLVNDHHRKDMEGLNLKHRQQVEKLEQGFQETLRQNERKMQELQTLRNNYEKKNASLTKDVKKLIIQLEKQTKSYTSNSVMKSIAFDDIDDNEAVKKLRDENAQLSEELIRKSQSLMNALRALAEFHRNPHNITKAIESGLSHVAHGDNNGMFDPHKKAEQLSSYTDVSNILKVSMEQNVEQSVSPETLDSASAHAPDVSNGGIVIGATYGLHDLPPSNSKFNRLKNRMGNKMKERITKLQQNMVNNQVQRMKTSQDDTLNELNARSAIKESEKIIITKTKQQLNSQCTELQGLANELSSTIEQKEVVLESLRFTNTYLGKRVIALEKLMHMQPGKEIPNQDELIRDALNIYSEEQEENDEAKTDEREIHGQDAPAENVEYMNQVTMDNNIINEDELGTQNIEENETVESVTEKVNEEVNEDEEEQDNVMIQVNEDEDDLVENVTVDNVNEESETNQDQKDEIETNLDEDHIEQKQEEDVNENEINVNKESNDNEQLNAQND